MKPEDKNHILDNLAESIGYTYDNSQDIFTARQDAFQKNFGYRTFYDIAATYVNMVFDYETVYFDYIGRTWLIEMWKGQYGINTGCELGVYYADSIISPDKYSTTHFTPVTDENMLEIYLRPNRHSPESGNTFTNLGQRKERHWWLTLFKMGAFTKPSDLFVNTSITFADCQMLNSFLESFRKALPHTTYKVTNLTVYFTFFQSDRTYSLYNRLVRRLSLATCKRYCNWFNKITKPFSNSGDKLLYLYFYMPFVVRVFFKKK